jgi:hypothetical protein
MLGLFNLISALFMATNKDKPGLLNSDPNMTACWLIFAKSFEQNVPQSCGEFVFGRIHTVDHIHGKLRNQGQVALAIDNCANKTTDTYVYVYIQIGQCNVSTMKEIDPATVPDGFFVDYSRADEFYPAVLNYVRTMNNCPIYNATVNNSKVLHTGNSEYNIWDLYSGRFCFGEWLGHDDGICDSSLLLQSISPTTPFPSTHSTDLIICAELISVAVLYVALCCCILKRNNRAGSDAHESMRELEASLAG